MAPSRRQQAQVLLRMRCVVRAILFYRDTCSQEAQTCEEVYTCENY